MSQTFAMPDYIRLNVLLGAYFFTTALLERRRRLLAENGEALREAFGSVRDRRPFRIDAIRVPRVADWPHSSFHRAPRALSAGMGGSGGYSGMEFGMMGPISRKAGYAIKPLTRPTVLCRALGSPRCSTQSARSPQHARDGGNTAYRLTKKLVDASSLIAMGIGVRIE